MPSPEKHLTDLQCHSSVFCHLSSELNQINEGWVIKELKSIQIKVTDKVTKIKLSETISVLGKMKFGNKISDNQVSSIMLSYELIKELKSKVNGK